MEWPWSHYLLRSRRKDCSSCSVVFVITWEYNFQIKYSSSSLLFFFFKLRLDGLNSFSYHFILSHWLEVVHFLASCICKLWFLNQEHWVLFMISFFPFETFFKFSCHSLYKDNVARKVTYVSDTIVLLRYPPMGVNKNVLYLPRWFRAPFLWVLFFI